MSSDATGPEPDSEVITLSYEVRMAAPVATVWERMFSSNGYRQWTASFTEGSFFEGSWEEGTRMRFLGPGDNGLLSEIATNRRHEEIRIRHIGMVMAGVEDTESDAVRAWAPMHETYRFRQEGDETVVSIEQQTLEPYRESIDRTWPQALEALKDLCEGPAAP